jgi:hypothetical protein
MNYYKIGKRRRKSGWNNILGSRIIAICTYLESPIDHKISIGIDRHIEKRSVNLKEKGKKKRYVRIESSGQEQTDICMCGIVHIRKQNK